MRLQLQKNAYHSARISANKHFLYGEKTISKLCTKSFDEILKYMEENNYEKSINLSYTRYEGFYLVERLLNEHASMIYSKVIKTAPKNNKAFLELYYLKYQIHNFMVYVRAKLAKETEYKAYLIGEEHKKEKFLKANSMELVDGVKYLCQKLSLDSEPVLEKLKEDLFSLENYLYYHYYERLHKITLTYNNREEKTFIKYLRSYVDLLNARTFLKVAQEKQQFKDLFLLGGDIPYEAFEKIDTNNKDYHQKIRDLVKVSDDEALDETINAHKRRSEQYFKQIRFASPFYPLKYLFTMEKEISQLRVMLKAKYSGLAEAQVRELVGVKA